MPSPVSFGRGRANRALAIPFFNLSCHIPTICLQFIKHIQHVSVHSIFCGLMLNSPVIRVEILTTRLVTPTRLKSAVVCLLLTHSLNLWIFTELKQFHEFLCTEWSWGFEWAFIEHWNRIAYIVNTSQGLSEFLTLP